MTESSCASGTPFSLLCREPSLHPHRDPSDHRDRVLHQARVILCRIQAHPSRNRLLPDLLKALEPLYVEVSQHSSVPPDPWGGYKQCLSHLPYCSHVLILQDDAQPVPGFAAAVEKIAQRHPHTPVCLFMGALPAATAAKARRVMGKRCYLPLGPASFVPLVAVLWPREAAVAFRKWSRTGKVTRADDGNAARWMKITRTEFLVTVPSLVQHNESVPSVKGSDNSGSWCSALFLAKDASDYDW